MEKEERRFSKRKLILIILCIFAVIVLALILIFAFYSKKCGDYDCFNKAVINCQKATYLDDSYEATWQYNVLGVKDKRCSINVQLLMIKEGKKEAKPLEGESMICYLSVDEVNTLLSKNQNIKPESDISKCHGLLKEDMQDIIIKNLWGEIYKNLGEIKEENINPI